MSPYTSYGFPDLLLTYGVTPLEFRRDLQYQKLDPGGIVWRY